MLRESDSPSLHLLAVVIDIAFYLTLVLILVAPLLSDVVLAFSPRGKFILLPRQKRAVYWALLPLAWGMLHFIYWALMGPRFGSVYALGWCGLAAFVHETNEYPQRWVRIRIFVVATVLLAIMLFVEYATYGIVRPTQLELLPYLYDQAGEVIPVDQLPQEIRSRADNFVSLRYRLILYPGLFVLLVGCFRDDVAGWFARRSPDQLDYDFD